MNKLHNNDILPEKAESEGYIVKTKEKDFPISNYPLEQTEFYYGQKQGMSSSNKIKAYSTMQHTECYIPV